MRHLVLVAPSANRVYSGDAARLMAAELRVLGDALAPGAFTGAEPVTVGGVDYLAVDTADDAPLAGDALRVVSNLSSVYAVFAQVGAPDEAPGPLLAPVELDRLDVFGSDLVTILKYQGKTNEAFTKLLLNVTAAATARPLRLLDRTLTVLDPMCGRGTTLNQALTYGLSTTGIDTDGKDFEAYSAFIQTYLKTGRYKHKATSGSLRVHGKTLGRRLEVELAASKEAYKAGDTQQLVVLNADTVKTREIVAPESHHVIVVDLPYGVQHGAHAEFLARSPLSLLRAALPGWVRALRTGGAMGLAFNRHTCDPDDLAALLEKNGLTVVAPPEPDAYRHRVDASIDRDVVVARKG